MSLVLDGSTDYLEIASPSITGRAFWISAWFKCDVDTGFNTIAGLFNSGDVGQWYRILASGATAGDPVRAEARLASAISQDACNTTTGYTVGTWHHAMVLFRTTDDANTIEVYIDGGSQGTDAGTRVPSGIDTLAIGRASDSTPSDYFDGKLADVAFGTGEPTSGQIASLAAGAHAFNVASLTTTYYLKLHTTSVEAVAGTTVTDGGTPTYDPTDHPPVDWPDEDDAVNPIGRWSSVPYQILRSGESLKVGLPAFSADGVQKVTFTVTPSAGTYSGTSPLDVTSMALNSDSGLWEYFITINTADFSTTCNATISAVITGNNGGTRSTATNLTSVTAASYFYHGLEDCVLRIDASGTDPPVVYAYVDQVSGNNGTAAVDTTNAFETIEDALDAIAAENNSNGHGSVIDSGIVYLVEDSYAIADNAGTSGTYSCSETWCTIMAAPGTDKAAVLVDTAPTGGPLYFKMNLLKLSGLTFSGNAVYAPNRNTPTGARGWMHDSSWIGDSSYNEPVNLVVGASTIKHWYVTDCDITHCDDGITGTGAAPYIALVRGCTISDLQNNAFGNLYFVANCIVDSLDPGDTGVHADLFQLQAHHSWENVLYYNIVARNLNYNGITLASSANNDQCYGLGIINVSMTFGDEDTAQQAIGSSRKWDHVLWWNITAHFTHSAMTSSVGRTVQLRDSQTGGVGSIVNGWCIGCTFPRMMIRNKSGGSNNYEDFAFRHCHLQKLDYGWDHGETPDVIPESEAITSEYGYDPSSGDPLISSSGRLTASSPLLSRLTRVVPIDALNAARSATADDSDIGAYEYAAIANAGALHRPRLLSPIGTRKLVT